MEANGTALAIRGLEKRYDDGTVALERLDLEVPAGTFFGLLGPNGAGKTTLISAVCNLIRVTAGDSSLRPRGPCSRLRRMIGVAEQDPNLDRFLTVREALVYHGGYFGLGWRHAVERAEEMIDIFDLGAKADVRAPKLSGGQRRRLLLARALLHEPRLVILDEPTAGVDIELRRELWRYIRRPGRGGHDHPPDHALPRGGRGAVRGHRADLARRDRRPLDTAGAQATVRRRLARGRLHVETVERTCPRPWMSLLSLAGWSACG